MLNIFLVEKQLEDATESQPAQCHSVLHLLHHCIEVFPECYVRKCSDSESSEKQESSKGKKRFIDDYHH